MNPFKIDITDRIPTVNINGTAKSELVTQQLNVAYAADALERALNEACPHGRDWQTVGGADRKLDIAHHAHHRLLRQASAIADQARELAIAIDNQPGK